jgi:hypothetical protein
MKTDSIGKWTILRLLVVLINILVIATYPQKQSNLDWEAALIIGIVPPIFLYIWLVLDRTRRNRDWSEPHSWTKPFLPMNLYPVRFWLLVSYSLMAAGGLALILDVFLRNGREAFGCTFLFLGLGIWIAAIGFIKKYIGTFSSKV